MNLKAYFSIQIRKNYEIFKTLRHSNSPIFCLNSSQPLKPILKPATLHPKVILFSTERPILRANIVDAMKVSPAPNVSTTCTGANEGLVKTSF